MGALTSFIFGMGMTVTACYIFLAIVLAPPLVKAGLDPLAVHLFVMYWGMVSYITPPVALATFAAAPLAGVSAMRIGLQSIRLGTAIYIVPFCFVLNPALLFKGDPAIVVTSIATRIRWASSWSPPPCRATCSVSAASARHAGRLARAHGCDRGGFLLAAPVAAPDRLAGFAPISRMGSVLCLGGSAFVSAFAAHSSKPGRSFP